MEMKSRTSISFNWFGGERVDLDEQEAIEGIPVGAVDAVSRATVEDNGKYLAKNYRCTCCDASPLSCSS